ncbi:MAG: hypothetical protein JWQ71_1550 [Pedosphaera sp.]|nr:hypothetical protein [Pedosphaera sp.]
MHDLVSLELARHIAAGLPQHPEWLAIACVNLERWSRLNASVPSLIRCYKEWQILLTQPVSEVCAALSAPTDEGQCLRQNSPFAGILSAKEVWEIKSRYRYATTIA